MAKEASDLFAEIEYEGERYTVYQSDFTARRLRQAKMWFGSDYGKYLLLHLNFRQGDADAVAFVIWVALDKEGKAKRDPRNLDFSVPEIVFGPSSDEVEDEIVEQVEEADESVDPPSEPSKPHKKSTSD